MEPKDKPVLFRNVRPFREAHSDRALVQKVDALVSNPPS